MPNVERIFGLMILHVVFGAAAACSARFGLGPGIGLKDLPIVPCLALNLCQASLLALWFVASSDPLRARLIGIVFGAIYLEVIVPPRLSREFLGISALALVLTLLSLLAVGAMGSRVERRTSWETAVQDPSKGLKLSIGGIMIFTAVVAVLCTLAKALQASGPTGFLLTFVLVLCFVAVGLMCIWAMLGKGRPVQRAPVVFIVSPLLGAFFAFAVQAHKEGWVYLLLIMTLFPAVLLGSLGVVRSCGYQFVGKPADTQVLIATLPVNPD